VIQAAAIIGQKNGTFTPWQCLVGIRFGVVIAVSWKWRPQWAQGLIIVTNGYGRVAAPARRPVDDYLPGSPLAAA
jgi:hypothetical protein